MFRVTEFTDRLAPLVILLTAVAGSAAGAEDAPHQALAKQYCVACHNDSARSGGIALDTILTDDVSQHSDTWEKVERRLRTRQMPPAGMPRPDEATYDKTVGFLADALDRAAAEHPNPGRTDTFRRLNRTEYGNAVRDLLALDIDAADLLPKDESSQGFDNITVGDLSPTLLDRYVSAAEKISRLAVGMPGRSPGGETIRIPPDLTQEKHINGLPIGTRGGAVVPYTFPVDGQYKVQIRLARDRNEQIEGLRGKHQIDLLLDRDRLAEFEIEPPATVGEHATLDQKLNLTFAAKAGPHEIGVAFVKQPWSLLETTRQPYEAHFNFYRHPRIQPAVYSVSILGPLEVDGVGDTPSRERIFVCRPGKALDEEDCAKTILENLAHHAYRRPVTARDIARPLEFYRQARNDKGFEGGIEMALRSILVSPEFLFRVEQDPAGLPPKTAYKLSDLELATRLSFFLWSSIPDDELLRVAESGELHNPETLDKQVKRMLADERSSSLVTNFASQWLYLRNLASTTPDMRLFPDFDDNLRQAMRRETELFFGSILHEDRNVLDLLDADYTFLNERLAKHYGIPYVYGSRFRKVQLDGDTHRGGLLRQGSILTVTSLATRTSPVIRGKWILTNLIGTPPPPPPPVVPALEEATKGVKNLTVRERLAAHRKNPACSGCHNMMDPVGFSLENFDAIGRWRTTDDGQPIDSSGGLPDGSEFDGVDGLQQALLARPEIFVGALAEKLLTYALGRGVETYDAPAIRRVIREAREDDYKFSSLVVGLAESVPFQMRTTK